jgi:hypothetical protein
MRRIPCVSWTHDGHRAKLAGPDPTAAGVGDLSLHQRTGPFPCKTDPPTARVALPLAAAGAARAAPPVRLNGRGMALDKL